MLSRFNPLHAGMLMAFIGFTAFAFSDVASKWLTQEYHIFQLVFLNHSFAIIFILLAMPFFGRYSDIKRTGKIKLHLFRGLLNTAVALSVIFSFSFLPIADVYTFIFTVPFFSAILALLIYKQSIGKHRAIAIIAGFIGVMVGLQPGATGFDPWLLVPILAGFLIALKFTISRSLEGEPMLLLGLWPLLVSAPLTGVLAFDHFEMPSLAHLGIHAFTGTCSAIGLICVSQGFRMAPAAAVSPFLYTEMIWALLFGYLIFGDVPGAWMMVGAAVIILAGLYLVERERRGEVPKPNTAA